MLNTKNSDLEEAGSKRLRMLTTDLHVPEDSFIPSKEDYFVLVQEIQALKQTVEQLSSVIVSFMKDLKQTPPQPEVVQRPSFKAILAHGMDQIGPGPENSTSSNSSRTSTKTNQKAATSTLPRGRVPVSPSSLQEQEFTTVQSKKSKRKSTQDPAPVPTKSIKDMLKSATTSEQKLKSLLRSSDTSPADRTDQVESLVLSLPLSAKAALSPMFSWKTVLKEMIPEHPILLVSLIHPRKAEIFYDRVHSSAIKMALDSHKVMVESSVPTLKDFNRRSKAYLNSYFLPMRRCALQSSSKEDSLAILEAAETVVKSSSDTEYKKKWIYQMKKDRDFILGLPRDQTMDSEEGDMPPLEECPEACRPPLSPMETSEMESDI